ncbi:hypothetical protein [Shimia thalassica]|uniref:hypothetical protein n=1 Tax=Shimia thalassica TaxID=1715693 RepID=UPI0026E1436C|nr:hypothetical protein [Shimia thalassica]MDO6483563.1 hypothetical protein [Shimia thalassica]
MMSQRILGDMPAKINATLATARAKFIAAGHSKAAAEAYAKADVRKEYRERQAAFETDYPQWKILFRKTLKQHLGGDWNV